MRKVTFLVLSLSLSIGMNSCKNSVQKKTDNQALIIGETLTVKSTSLGENRVLNIYLPLGYKENDSDAYPVVYLLDGGIDEDFIHVAGLYQISSSEWIQRVKPSIIVGITNVDRLRDFTFLSSFKDEREKFKTSGHSDKFMTFLCHELPNFIDSIYRTTDERTLIGESLGGLMATQVFLKSPETFNRYVIISPSLWWDDGSLFNSDFKSAGTKARNNTQVYIAVGQEGQNEGPRPHVMEVDARRLFDTMAAQNYSNVKIGFNLLKEENHSTVGHIALYSAIRGFQAMQDTLQP